jgi:sigma-E factor negative regulatory protein RseC
VKEVGQVASVKGDAAVVVMPISGECERCGICMVAGNGREVILLAKNSVGAAQGDAVEVEIGPGKVLAAAFTIYMVPVIMTIAGFALGNALTGGAEDAELPILLAVAFLVASFAGVWLYDRHLRKAERRQAIVVRILSEDEAKSHARVESVTFGG